MTTLTQLDPGRSVSDAQQVSAGVNDLSSAIEHPQATISDPGHSNGDARNSTAGADLAFACASLDEIEATRMAIENRIRAKEQDAELAGALEAHHASIGFQRAALLLGAVEDVEKVAIKEVQRLVRLHPLGGWIKTRRGIGEKQGARLIAALGDPLWNAADGRPRRGPAELWQYAGHGDPARSRLRKGSGVEFNPTVKMRVHLCATSCMKAGSSPFRDVYDTERAKWADRDTTNGHKHNHALRIVGKAILLDLWTWKYAMEVVS